MPFPGRAIVCSRGSLGCYQEKASIVKPNLPVTAPLYGISKANPNGTMFFTEKRPSETGTICQNPDKNGRLYCAKRETPQGWPQKDFSLTCPLFPFTIIL
jgi:hypothetical protein